MKYDPKSDHNEPRWHSGAVHDYFHNGATVFGVAGATRVHGRDRDIYVADFQGRILGTFETKDDARKAVEEAYRAAVS